VLDRDRSLCVSRAVLGRAGCARGGAGVSSCRVRE
jgi:hypothetical protein